LKCTMPSLQEISTRKTAASDETPSDKWNKNVNCYRACTYVVKWWHPNRKRKKLSTSI
jgi:hypothetical protein